MNTDEREERQQAPERIWLSPTSFNYKTTPAPAYIYSENEREPHDVEYVRADLTSRASVPAVGEDALFTAYNQAIEDAKAAIRGEKVDDPYAAATFINAIARKCSPHMYVARLAAASSPLPAEPPTYRQLFEPCALDEHSDCIGYSNSLRRDAALVTCSCECHATDSAAPADGFHAAEDVYEATKEFWPAEPLQPTDGHRCPRCGRRMQSDFDEDVGTWYECANCDYREAVSSRPAEPEGEQELRTIIERVIRQHRLARTHNPTYCCPEDEAFYDRQLMRMLVDELRATTPSAALATAKGWQYTHERDADLIRKEGMMCEVHPGLEFGHDPNCAGPGMAWIIEGRAAIKTLLSVQAQQAERIAIEILDSLNFDTSLDIVQEDVARIEEILIQACRVQIPNGEQSPEAQDVSVTAHVHGGAPDSGRQVVMPATIESAVNEIMDHFSSIEIEELPERRATRAIITRHLAGTTSVVRNYDDAYRRACAVLKTKGLPVRVGNVVSEDNHRLAHAIAIEFATTTSPETPVGGEAHYLPNWLWCGRCKAWIETAHQCGAQYIDKGTHFEFVKPAAPVVAAGDDEGDRMRCALCKHPFCKECYDLDECCKCYTEIPPRTVAERLAQHEHIYIVPGVLGGVTPLVGRTRISVHHILTYLYNGNSVEYIADTYHLSPEAIKDAIAFAQNVYDDAVDAALRTPVEGEEK